MEVKINTGRGTVTVNETLWDRVVRYYDPIKGQARLQKSMMSAVAGSYHGASKSSRSLKEWTTLGKDADGDLLRDLPTLRQRCRDLVRNSPLAGAALNTMVTNTMGPGLKVKPTIDSGYLGLTDEQVTEWEGLAGRLFGLWGGSSECDLSRVQNFNELQALAFRSTLENGDVFGALPNVKRKGSPFSLKVQLIEADRVENKDFATDTNRLAGGVQMDKHGAPEAYHFLKTHPGNILGSNREWQIVPAFGAKTGRRNILHLFERKRPGQNRGAPFLAPVIELFKQLERYTDAELMAAVVSGMFTVFVKTENGDALDTFEPSGETGGKSTDEDYKLGNGAIVNMGANDSIDTADPGRPNSNFDPFVSAIIQQIGANLELPSEIILKKFTKSYSAARAALLEAWRMFITRRVWMIDKFCQPIYEAFITEQIAEGRLTAPGFFNDPLTRQAYLGAVWTGRPPGQLDPLKENNADVIAEDRHWKTASQNTAEKMGGDFAQNVIEAGKEAAMVEAAGLKKEAPPPDQFESDDEQEAKKMEEGDEEK